MAKKILLEHDEVKSLVDILKETNVSVDIMHKFVEALERENKESYKKKKGIVSKHGFWIYDNFYNNPLEYQYQIKPAKNIRDWSKSTFEFLSGNYYIKRKKEEVFAHKWEAQLYVYNKHIKMIDKKLNTLKSDKGRYPYLILHSKIEKKIKSINDHPEKLI
jgi:tRNA G10  N-methylase Trm11